MDIAESEFPTIDELIKAYYEEITALALLLLAGGISQREYANRHFEITIRYQALVLEFFSADTRNPELIAIIRQERLIARESTANISRDIQNGRYSEQINEDGIVTKTEEEGRTQLLARLALWTYSLSRVSNGGLVYSRSVRVQNIPLEWVYNPAKEHCTDCRSLNGQVKTAQEWANAGIVPQSPDLECKGYRCGCRFKPRLPRGTRIVA